MAKQQDDLQSEDIVARFAKSDTQEVRVRLTEFNGHRVFDFRTWVDRNGEMIPTKKGLMLRVDVFPEFRAAVCKLEEAVHTLEKALTAEDAR